MFQNRLYSLVYSPKTIQNGVPGLSYPGMNNGVDMAIRTGDFDGAMTERCEACGRETRHEVSIRLHTESDRTKNAEYSREPYRVSACQVCGAEQTLRMNDA